MGLANCKECGKLFMQNPAGVCPDCYRLEQDQEELVAKYLRDHRKASITEVNEATGVPEKIILKMVKKGRITGDISLDYPCESCGKPIQEGRVCRECSQNVLSQVKPEAKPAPAPAPERPKSGGLHMRLGKD